MPKLIRSTKHGILTFIGQNTITIGDQDFPLEIERFNGPDSCLTFFGEKQLLKEIDETPNPRDYFKKFRAERYDGELRSLAKAIPARTDEWKEIKRDIFRAFYIQIAIEASVLFPQVEEPAKRWLEGKMKTQRCLHEFEQVWSGYRSLPMPVVSKTGVIFDIIYSRNKQRLQWLSLKSVLRKETSTTYKFVGCTVMNGRRNIQKKSIPWNVKNRTSPLTSSLMPPLDPEID